MYAGSYQRIVGADIGGTLASERLLARLGALHPTEVDLSLDRLERLLADLGHPERKLPPVVHVAGTNGKGSTIAFLRSILEGSGAQVHAYTSPHLVTFNERIRLGSGPGCSLPISEDLLSRCLSFVEEVNSGRPITFFEITTAAAFVAFSETPADAVLLETGLGGRLDATNVVQSPRATVITPVSFDHTALLGDTLSAIAREKAGILKPGAPCIVALQDPQALSVIEARASDLGVPLVRFGFEFEAYARNKRLIYSSGSRCFDLPLPDLRGVHQVVNAGLAIATAEASFPGMLDLCPLDYAVQYTCWEGRLQTLGTGVLSSCVEPGTEIVVDGGHNPGGADALAAGLSEIANGREVHLVVGMIDGKDSCGVFEKFRGRVERIYTVPIAERDDAVAADKLAVTARNMGCVAEPARGIIHALLMSRAAMRRAGLVLICGSLYLVGHVLKVHNGA